MTTFATRSHHYIRETLESLFASDWIQTNRAVNLIMGSADESHILEYTTDPRVRIVHWDAQDNEVLRWNCTLNKIRALHHGDDEPTLICEDDIVFLPDWLSTLKQAAAEMGDVEYILSLSAAKPDLAKARLVAGKQWVKRYPTYVLQGAQALYYPTKALREKVADYLQAHLTRGNGDELIGRYARAYGALYATSDVQVEHVGFVSCFPRERPPTP